MLNDDPKDHCSSCRARGINRRDLLLIAGQSTGLAMIGVTFSGCAPPTGSPPTGPVNVGNVSALSVGTMLVESNVVVARDAGGVYAMSAVCTHAGCLLSDSNGTIANGLYCPCHGSTFDGSGSVSAGPARTPLQHYAVTIAADGSMTADGSQRVSASTRTPVA
jgi:nitrite reductase/ring-hydroxylating ferredoxin subunit